MLVGAQDWIVTCLVGTWHRVASLWTFILTAVSLAEGYLQYADFTMAYVISSSEVYLCYLSAFMIASQQSHMRWISGLQEH